MWRKPKIDSLDTVELVMSFEEELGIDLPEDLDNEDMRLLLEVLGRSSEARWAPDGVPAMTVLVMGQAAGLALFAMPNRTQYGVGRLNALGSMENAQVYPSLKRALFAFARARE